MNVNVIFAGNPAKSVKRKEDYKLDENNDKAIDIDPILRCKDMKIAAVVEMIIHTRYSSCIGKQKCMLTVQQTIRTLCIYTEYPNNSYK